MAVYLCKVCRCGLTHFGPHPECCDRPMILLAPDRPVDEVIATSWFGPTDNDMTDPVDLDNLARMEMYRRAASNEQAIPLTDYIARHR